MPLTVEDPRDERARDECRTLERLRSLLSERRRCEEHRIDEALALIARRLDVLRGAGPEVERRTPAATPTGEGYMTEPTRTIGGRIHLVGRSAAMREIEHAIQRVSQSTATVLIRGESGTGKELVARAIHALGDRAGGPFVPLHCAAVADTLLESELFGHERGAFTGAQEQRKGKFEAAHGGTLFLDEIGDIPPATQVKLLRVLQDKCVERVGGGKPIPVDVRVISATHRDLEAMVQAGAFREDLYYRVNVVPITLPPLRERDGDIRLLIDHFLVRLNEQHHRRIRLEDDLLVLMARYHWPGNVRELQNCIERLVVLAPSGRETISLDTVPSSLRAYFHDMMQVTTGGGGAADRTQPSGLRLSESLQDLEREQLRAALIRAGWVQARAARALGLTPRQVAYKIRKYGIGEQGGLR